MEIHAPIQENREGDRNLVAFSIEGVVSFGFVKALVSVVNDSTTQYFAVVDSRHIIQQSMNPFFLILGPEGHGMLKIDIDQIVCACSFLPLPGTPNIFPLFHTLSPHVRIFGNATGTKS
jgi:hypothetical protein